MSARHTCCLGIFALRMLPAVGLLISGTLFAQAPAVTSVGYQGQRFSPGALARVEGANFTGPVAVQVGGRPAAVLNVSSPTSMFVQLPVELALGATTLVVTASGGGSAPFSLMVDPYAPSLTGFGVGCKNQGPADQGPVGVAIAWGLGATDPAVATGQVAPAAPLARTVAKPAITIAGRAAEVLESVLVTWYPGVYQVNFRVPAGLPPGRHPGLLSIGGKDSNIATIEITTTDFIIASATAGQLGPAAPESLMTAMHCGGLATATVTGDARNPPTTLGGTTVRVRDSAGVERLAPLQYVSAGLVKYMIPSGTATGEATVTISSDTGFVFSEPLEIQTVAPGVFQFPYEAIPDDQPIPVAHVVRLRGGVATIEPVEPGIRIDMGPDTDQLFLVLFGTGLRFRSSLANVSVKIGVVDAPVEYAGPQGEFAGLDQVNVRLPRSLAGCGSAPVELMVDGKVANVTHLAFK